MTCSGIDISSLGGPTGQLASDETGGKWPRAEMKSDSGNKENGLKKSDSGEMIATQV